MHKCADTAHTFSLSFYLSPNDKQKFLMKREDKPNKRVQKVRPPDIDCVHLNQWPGTEVFSHNLST